IPERACPQIYKLGTPTVIFGQHPDTGEMFVDHSVDVLSAYTNAVKGQDGWGSMPASFGNLIRATAEVNESIFPVRHECCDFQIDTGGPGQWRGCPGSRIEKRMLAPATGTTLWGGRRGRGVGRPPKRAPERVLDRVLHELVSQASAERDYGVVFTGPLEDDTLAVDHEATKKRREQRVGA